METVTIGNVSLELLPQVMRRVETLRIGTKVKVLRKEAYGDKHKVYPGIIIGFEPFKKLPTAIIAYADISYSAVDLKFLAFNTETTDVEVVAAASDDEFTTDDVQAEKWFAKEIEKKHREVADLEYKRDFFRTKLGRAWEQVSAEAPVAA